MTAGDPALGSCHGRAPPRSAVRAASELQSGELAHPCTRPPGESALCAPREAPHHSAHNRRRRKLKTRIRLEISRAVSAKSQSQTTAGRSACGGPRWFALGARLGHGTPFSLRRLRRRRAPSAARGKTTLLPRRPTISDYDSSGGALALAPRSIPEKSHRGGANDTGAGRAYSAGGNDPRDGRNEKAWLEMRRRYPWRWGCRASRQDGSSRPRGARRAAFAIFCLGIAKGAASVQGLRAAPRRAELLRGRARARASAGSGPAAHRHTARVSAAPRPPPLQRIARPRWILDARSPSRPNRKPSNR